MGKPEYYRSLIYGVRLGSKEAMDALAKMTEEKLFPYIYRLTLNHELTRDLVQETLLEMIRSVNNLENVDCFWSWLYRIALGKVQHHFRDLQRQRKVEISATEKERIRKRTKGEFNDGLDTMVRGELSAAMFEAVSKLKVKYRNVLALRCFEQMQYTQIALVMDCSELHARVLFFRAKNLLRKNLSRQGFSKKFFLVGLTLFGLVTTPAKAATTGITINAALLDVGLIATVLGTFVSKLGLALAAMLVAAWGTLSLNTLLCAIVIIVCLGMSSMAIYLYNVYS